MNIDPKEMFQAGVLNAELTLTLVLLDAGWSQEEASTILAVNAPAARHWQPWPDEMKQELRDRLIANDMERLSSQECREFGEKWSRTPTAIRTTMDVTRNVMLREQKRELEREVTDGP